ATTFVDAPASGLQAPSPVVPTASPITTVASGLVVVSVTSVVPLCDTGKLWNALEPICTVPENVSVVLVVVGALTVPLGELLLHALTATTHSIANNARWIMSAGP